MADLKPLPVSTDQQRLEIRIWLRWIAANVIGMVVAFGGMRYVPDQVEAYFVIGSGMAVGLAMGGTVAALTGLALLWILRGDDVGDRSALD